jgi:hypothetical protein
MENLRIPAPISKFMAQFSCCIIGVAFGAAMDQKLWVVKMRAS